VTPLETPAWSGLYPPCGFDSQSSRESFIWLSFQDFEEDCLFPYMLPPTSSLLLFHLVFQDFISKVKAEFLFRKLSANFCIKKVDDFFRFQNLVTTIFSFSSCSVIMTLVLLCIFPRLNEYQVFDTLPSRMVEIPPSVLEEY